MEDLTFYEDTHKYFLGDVSIPSVSEIIRPIYEKVYKNIDKTTLKEAAGRGTRVHRAIEFISKYNLYKFDGDTAGYVKAYQKFRSDNPDWKLLNSELRTYHKALLYGMTVDEIYNTPKGIAVLDIKTTKSAHSGAWSVQLAAYKAGYESQYKKVSNTFILQLFENGKYILHEVKDNFQVFLSCLEIYNFEV